MIYTLQSGSHAIPEVLRQRKATTTQNQTVLSVYQPENHIVTVTANRFRQQRCHNSSVFQEA